MWSIGYSPSSESMSDEPSIDDTRDLVATRLDQSIDEPHHILEVVIAGGDEFFDVFAVIAAMNKDGMVDNAYHQWALEVHKLKVTRWGDILADEIIKACDP